jgi:hypothetical protein
MTASASIDPHAIEITDSDFDKQRLGWDVYYLLPDDDEDGEPHKGFVPAHYEVCGRCRGTGKHSNPAIDGNGITQSEFAEWDDEDREGYFNGQYDITCSVCIGERVVAELPEIPEDPKAVLEPLVIAFIHFVREGEASIEASRREQRHESMMLGEC